MTTPTQTPVSQEERSATVHATALALAAAWNDLHRAQLDLLRVLEKRRADRMMGSTQRLRSTLQVFLDAVAAFDRTARAIVERWAARDLPVFYRDGAVQALERTVHSVQQQATLFSWTSRHQEAITGLSAQFYTDLIARITEAVRRAHVFVREAQAQTRKRDGINRTQLLEAHPLDTVVYRDQSKHPVVSWATGSLTAQSATVTNAGALNYGQWDLDAQWMECVDNPECGFTGHGDLDKAHGTIRSADDANTWPVSHFACIRSWIPRPDLNGRPDLASGAEL